MVGPEIQYLFRPQFMHRTTKDDKICPFSYLKGQCHEIFDFRFFHELVSPKLLNIPLGPFRISLKIRGDIRCSRCTTGVVNTVVHLDLPISPRKNRNDPNVIFRGLGLDDS